MSTARLDRCTLSKAAPAAAQRLAKYVGVPMPDTCGCPRCAAALVEALVRKLDTEDSWPPRKLSRDDEETPRP